MPYPNNEHLQCLSTLVDTNANATRKKASVSRPSSSLLASAFVSSISSSASKTSELQRSFQACTKKTSFILPPLASSSSSSSSTARPTTPPPSSAATSSSSPPSSLDILDPINNENADDDFDAGEIR